MKRSEAIKIIQSVIDQSYDHPAVTILMKLEDAGLLPPEIYPAEGDKCSNPSIDIGPEYFEEYVPRRITIGWQDET